MPYTNGPWTAGTNDSCRDIPIFTVLDRKMVGSASWEDTGYSEREANAALMSAAPELLAACQELLDWASRIRNVRDAGWPDVAVPLAKSAVAKATGGTPP